MVKFLYQDTRSESAEFRGKSPRNADSQSNSLLNPFPKPREFALYNIRLANLDSIQFIKFIITVNDVGNSESLPPTDLKFLDNPSGPDWFLNCCKDRLPIAPLFISRRFERNKGKQGMTKMILSRILIVNATRLRCILMKKMRRMSAALWTS
jgi:hypothetical protein